MKIHPNFISVLLYIFFAAPATWSAEPFKLLTVEPAALPEKNWTVGLQQTGFSWDDFYVNTNTIMDLTMTGNLGLKYVSKVNNSWAFTAGARYIHFFGESTLEDFAKKQNSMIESLKVKYNGYNAFVGTSYYWDWGAAHINTQYANVSDSKILNLISALNIKMGPSWHTVIEAGHDFENKQPRGSLGILRSGETFGLRLGITYVEIKDPSININLLPVLDFYWNFGDAR